MKYLVYHVESGASRIVPRTGLVLAEDSPVYCGNIKEKSSYVCDLQSNRAQHEKPPHDR